MKERQQRKNCWNPFRSSASETYKASWTKTTPQYIKVFVCEQGKQGRYWLCGADNGKSRCGTREKIFLCLKYNIYTGISSILFALHSTLHLCSIGLSTTSLYIYSLVQRRPSQRTSCPPGEAVYRAPPSVCLTQLSGTPLPPRPLLLSPPLSHRLTSLRREACPST